MCHTEFNSMLNLSAKASPINLQQNIAVEVFTAIAASDSRLHHAPPSTLGFTMPREGLLLDRRIVFSGHPTTGRRRSALRTRQKNCGLGNLGIEMLHTYILHAHTIHVHITITFDAARILDLLRVCVCVPVGLCTFLPFVVYASLRSTLHNCANTLEYFLVLTGSTLGYLVW